MQSIEVYIDAIYDTIRNRTGYIICYIFPDKTIDYTIYLIDTKVDSVALLETLALNYAIINKSDISEYEINIFTDYKPNLFINEWLDADYRYFNGHKVLSYYTKHISSLTDVALVRFNIIDKIIRDKLYTNMRYNIKWIPSDSNIADNIYRNAFSEAAQLGNGKQRLVRQWGGLNFPLHIKHKKLDMKQFTISNLDIIYTSMRLSALKKKSYMQARQQKGQFIINQRFIQKSKQKPCRHIPDVSIMKYENGALKNICTVCNQYIDADWPITSDRG